MGVQEGNTLQISIKIKVIYLDIIDQVHILHMKISDMNLDIDLPCQIMGKINNSKFLAEQYYPDQNFCQIWAKRRNQKSYRILSQIIPNKIWGNH